MKKTLLIIFTLSLTLLLADRIQDFTVQDIDGNQVNFYEKLMNGPVILDFWATWCKPCLKELPHLNAIASKYEQVTVIAISVDKPRKAADVRTTIKSNQFKFITVHDTSQQLQKLLNVTSVPRTIIVDREGEIKLDHSSYNGGDEVQIEEMVISLLPAAQDSLLTSPEVDGCNKRTDAE